MTLTFAAGVWVGASLVVLIIALGAVLRAMDAESSAEREQRCYLGARGIGKPMTTEPDPIESYPPAPLNCRHEPPYLRHRTVVFSIRNPDMTVHRRTLRCPVEYPHLIAACGEFAVIHPRNVQPRNLA